MLAVTASSAEWMTHRKGELLGQPNPYPRCLSSMLSNHDRESISEANKYVVRPKEENEKEVELESSSLFVKLEHRDDISPLFSTEESNKLIRAATRPSSSRPPPPPSTGQLPVKRYSDAGVEGKSKIPISSTSNQKDQGSGRDLLLADLFPGGFTSTIAPPLAKITVVEDLPSKQSSTNAPAEADKESELEGTQAWTHLVPSCAPPEVATVKASQQENQHGQKSQHHNVVPSKELPRPSVLEVDLSSVTPHPMFGKLHLSCDAYGKSGERTKVESAVAVVPMAVAAEKRPTACSNDGDITTICNGPDEGETEEGVSSKETVAVREREEELKRALDRLVPRLLQSEERVKYMERRLQEAMRGESGRNALLKHVAKLEGEVKHLRERLELRHREALEWRDMKQTLEADNARLNAELHKALDRGVRLDCENRRRDTLLAEAQANADGLIEKNASLEAELRHKDQRLGEAEKERKRAWQTTNASAQTVKAAIRRAEAAAMEADNLRNEVRQRENAKLSLEGQRQRSLGADGGWGAKRLSWEPELDRPRSSPMERDRSRGHSLSPNRGRSVGRTKRHPIEDSGTLGGQKLDFHDDFVNYSSVTSPPTGDSLARRSVIDVTNGNKLPKAGSRLSSDSDGIRGQLIAPRQESAWVNDVDDVPPVAARTKGREQCDIGDRQRYDSEGVKGALTAARPEWADNAPVAISPKGTNGCDHGDNVSNIESSGCQMQLGYADIDQGQDEGAQWRDSHSARRSTDEPLLTELAALGWTLSRQSFPAAGHRRGRDALSSRRSSLTGAGVGVHSESDNGEAGQVTRTETMAPASKEGGTDGGMLASTHGTTEFDRRNTVVGSASWRAPTRPSSCLADMIEKSPPDANAQPEKIRRERGPVPFATEAAEHELRPVREVEKKLMLLQMEASQLEAEQSKLFPKASKTMHARVRMRDIESRLERLAKESSGLRRILRNKPWRM